MIVLGGCGTWASRTAAVPDAPSELVSVAGRARVTLATGERVVLHDLYVTPDSVHGIRADGGGSFAASRREVVALESREMDRGLSATLFALAWVVGYVFALGGLVAATWD